MADGSAIVLRRCSYYLKSHFNNAMSTAQYNAVVLKRRSRGANIQWIINYWYFINEAQGNRGTTPDHKAWKSKCRIHIRCTSTVFIERNAQLHSPLVDGWRWCLLMSNRNQSRIQKPETRDQKPKAKAQSTLIETHRYSSWVKSHQLQGEWLHH